MSLCVCQSAPVRALVVPVCCERGLCFKNSSSELVRSPLRFFAQSRHRAHTRSQREESGESQFLGSLWRATLSREAWMPIWGLSTESMKPWPPPGGGRGYRTKRWRWCGGTGVPGGHDTHRPFTNRKAAPGEGTVIRARVGRPIPFRARSAQGPVHFPPTREFCCKILHLPPTLREKRKSSQLC